MKKTQQTLIYRNYFGQHGKRVRSMIKPGNVLEEVRNWPSVSYGGHEYYSTARLITKRDRASKWYKQVEFDENGYGIIRN